MASQKNYQDKLWMILKVILALALFGFVLTKIRREDVAALIQRISLGWLLPRIFFYTASFWWIAKRYQKLISDRIPFDQVFGVVLVQTILASLFTNIAGLTYYVAMLRGKYQIGLGNGVWSLVAARFFDVIVWLPLFCVTSWMLWTQLAPLQTGIYLIISLMAALVMSISLTLVFRHRFLDLFKRILKVLNLDQFPLVIKIITTLESLAKGKILQNYGKLLFYSVMTFICSSISFYSTLKLLGISINIVPFIFIAILLQLLMVLPIHVFNGLGWVDISFLYLFGLFGYNEHLIAPVVVVGRILGYAINCLLLLYFPGRNILQRYQNNR